jgi:uncharacterized protein YndB with AHSA1/START domain
MTEAAEFPLTMNRRFRASAEAVFDAWIEREQWQSWLGPNGVTCEVPLLEPKVGGRYRVLMHVDPLETLHITGVFKIVDRPRQLVFTWGAEGDPSRQSLVTLTLRAVGGETELTLRQDGLGGEANRESHRIGWAGALDKLEHYLAHAVEGDAR